MPISLDPSTQDARSLIILNYNNSVSAEHRLTDTNFVFEAPWPNPDTEVSKNTRLLVRAKASSGQYGVRKLYYDRLNLTSLTGHPEIDWALNLTLGQVVAFLNDWYGISLTPMDYLVSAVGPAMTLQAHPASLLFTGTLAVNSLTQ